MPEFKRFLTEVIPQGSQHLKKNMKKFCKWGVNSFSYFLFFLFKIHMNGKGSLPIPKWMNFWKSSKRGGGSFPIQKFLLQILDFWTGFFWHKNDTKGVFSGYVSKNLQHNFPKMRRGGGQRPFGTFPKFFYSGASLGCPKKTLFFKFLFKLLKKTYPENTPLYHFYAKKPCSKVQNLQ